MGNFPWVFLNLEKKKVQFFFWAYLHGNAMIRGESTRTCRKSLKLWAKTELKVVRGKKFDTGRSPPTRAPPPDYFWTLKNSKKSKKKYGLILKQTSWFVKNRNKKFKKVKSTAAIKGQSWKHFENFERGYLLMVHGWRGYHLGIVRGVGERAWPSAAAGLALGKAPPDPAGLLRLGKVPSDKNGLKCQNSFLGLS